MPGQYLSSLQISHFRSHRVSRIETDARPVAIYGDNGAGKTNILEAISLLSPGRGLRRATTAELSRRPEDLGWKVSATVSAGGQAIEIETSAEPEQARHVKVDGKAAPQLALARATRIVWLVPAMDRLWTEGAEARRRFLDRMVMSFEPGHAETVLAYEKAMRERNRLLKDMVRDDHWYVALEMQMAESGIQIMENRNSALLRLAAAQSKAETAFPAADLSLSHAGNALPAAAEELATQFREGRSQDLRAGRTLIGPHRVDMEALFSQKGIPAAQCSTGEQKALLISLVLTNARALSEEIGASPLILLDEVAAHLDGSRRAALYDEICVLGAQAWMTGTGSELFDDLGDRAQHFSVEEVAGISSVSPVMRNRDDDNTI